MQPLFRQPRKSALDLPALTGVVAVLTMIAALTCGACAPSTPSLPDFPPFAAGQEYLDGQVRVQQDLRRSEELYSSIAQEGQQRIYLRGREYLQARQAMLEAYRVQQRQDEQARRQYQQVKQEQDRKRWEEALARSRGT